LTKRVIVPVVDPTISYAAEADDQGIIRGEEVKTIAKQRLKLAESLKKGYQQQPVLARGEGLS
jgi:hypothetical protein